MRQSTKTTLTTRGFRAFLPCRAPLSRSAPPRSFGARAASSATVSFTYRQAGRPDPEPGGQLGECLAFAQVGKDQERPLPGVQPPPQRPDRSPVAADDPGRVVEKKAGYAYVVLDGTLIAIDRVAADRPSHSGKHKRHGMNPTGQPPALTATSAGSPARCPARSTTRKPNGSWRPARAGGRRPDHARR
jgi:hypothetical protein